MNPRFKGLGFLFLLVPVLSYIPLRALVGDWEETHRSIVLFISLAVSGAIIFVIATIQDKKIGISTFSGRAWTSDFLVSQHICLYVPLRLGGIVFLAASVVVLFL
jgi:hypothetical protein